jgi:hypothetical protein
MDTNPQGFENLEGLFLGFQNLEGLFFHSPSPDRMLQIVWNPIFRLTKPVHTNPQGFENLEGLFLGIQNLEGLLI